MNQNGSESASSRVGTTVKDKWQIDRLIGAGATSSVFAATHRNGNRVAIKVLHAKFATHTEVRQRFLSEGYLANRVSHRGTVTVHDDDITEDGCPFLVLDLLDGQTVQSIVEEREAPLPVGAVLAIADQVLETLGSAHSSGIVHRDVKPDNVFVTTAGEVKLLDFGIARTQQRGPGRRRTLQGIAMGTPAFMPPEQARGEWDRVDTQTDVWAVGASMFYLLTQETVHDDATPDALMSRASSKTARPLGLVAASVPAVVQAVVDKALAFDKRDRFRDAEQMRRAVRAAMAIITEPINVPRPRVMVHTADEAVNVNANTIPRTALSEPPSRHVSEPPRLFAPKRTKPPRSSKPDWDATWAAPHNQDKLELLTPRWEKLSKELLSEARILVVDSNQSVRRVLSDTLGAAGYSVDAVGSVNEAIEHLSSTRYDLMVTDEAMPEGSGLELIARARAMTRELPIALVTAHVSAESIEEALGNGVVDYITKPFRSLEHLTDRVGSIIHRRILELIYDVMIGDLVALSWEHGAETPDVDVLLSSLTATLDERCDVALLGATAQTAVLAATLDAAGMTVTAYDDPASMMASVRAEGGPLSAIIALDLPGARFLVRDLRALDPFIEVLVTTEDSSSDAALEAVTAGASDFVLPREGGVLLARRLQRLVDRGRNRRTVIAVIAELYRVASGVDAQAAKQLLAAIPPDERDIIGMPA